MMLPSLGKDMVDCLHDLVYTDSCQVDRDKVDQVIKEFTDLGFSVSTNDSSRTEAPQEAEYQMVMPKIEQVASPDELEEKAHRPGELIDLTYEEAEDDEDEEYEDGGEDGADDSGMEHEQAGFAMYPDTTNENFLTSNVENEQPSGAPAEEDLEHTKRLNRLRKQREIAMWQGPESSPEPDDTRSDSPITKLGLKRTHQLPEELCNNAEAYSSELPGTPGKKPRGCKVKYPLTPAQEELVKFYKLIEEALPNPRNYAVGKEIRCFHCNKTYAKPRSWKDHIMDEHYHRAQTCENCGEKFEFTFYQHRRTCISETGKDTA